jgi:hypothetical protein
MGVVEPGPEPLFKQVGFRPGAEDAFARNVIAVVNFQADWIG